MHEQYINAELLLQPFQVTFTRVQDEGSRLRIECEVVAVEDGERIPVTFNIAMAPRSFQPAGKLRARLIRDALRDVLMHELDECLRFVDGTPVEEPHPVHPRSF